MEKKNCTLISDGKNWVKQAAKDQLLAMNRLPGIVKAVGLPDLHPGRIPAGTAVLSRGILYPHLLGSDVGYGMGLSDTGIRKKKFKQEKWVSRLKAIQDLGDILFSDPYEEECPIRDLRTLGRGNHFVEFQYVEQIYNRNSIRYTGLKNRVICHDTNLLFTETPEACKNVGQVIGALQEYGPTDMTATLRPLITFKRQEGIYESAG